MTKYVIPRLEFIEDIRKLLDDKRLIILQEAVRYCKEKNIDKIRYSVLKRLCNDRLSDLTDGHETDLGGNFEKYIVDLESNYEPSKSFLKRYKQSTRKSFIIPDIPKIINLLDKRDLNNLVKTIEECKEPYGAFSLMDFLTYSPLTYSSPGYETFISKDDDIRKSTAIYTSNLLNIYTNYPEDKNLRLKEDDIQQLLFLGKAIASRDRSKPFKLIVEYKGDTYSSEKEELF
jgi:hypothetical protein